MTHLNASNLLNFDSSNRFLPIASKSWCSCVSKMASGNIYILCRFICSKIKCVIRQFLASKDLIVNMIFEWLEFLVEVQTEKTEKLPQKTEIYRKKSKATANFKFGTVPPPIYSNV